MARTKRTTTDHRSTFPIRRMILLDVLLLTTLRLIPNEVLCRRLIHRSAWKGYSAKLGFRFTEFSEVGGVLRSWLRGSADGIMLVVEGEIPRWLKRESPVVDLIEERSPGELS
jgi:hypothetical protein